ncbi:unnamed protein product, partial [Mesorhabditis spiculigera]
MHRLLGDWSDKITFGEKPISIPAKNDRYKAVLYDGDMLLSPGQLQKIADNAIGGRQKREAYLDEFYPSTIWQDGVPYELHSSLCDPRRPSLRAARHPILGRAYVHQVPTAHQGKLLLRFVGYESGCWSAVGRDDTEPIQIVSIGRGCEHFGVTSHELAHALGVFHEQSRHDRDKFVTLNSRAVDRDILYNFAKVAETVRKFEISIVQTGNTLKDKMCVYQLRAPAGKKILLNLLRVSGKCIEGCYVDGVEAKMRKDKRPVGYR